jgi:hypothetical protein
MAAFTESPLVILWSLYNKGSHYLEYTVDTPDGKIGGHHIYQYPLSFPYSQPPTSQGYKCDSADVAPPKATRSEKASV